MMAEFKKGDTVIALCRENQNWIVAKVVDWLPRAKQFQVRRWDYAKAKWNGVERMPPMNIAGKIPSAQIKPAAEQLNAIANMRQAEVDAADRHARRAAFKLLP